METEPKETEIVMVQEKDENENVTPPPPASNAASPPNTSPSNVVAPASKGTPPSSNKTHMSRQPLPPRAGYRIVRVEAAKHSDFPSQASAPSSELYPHFAYEKLPTMSMNTEMLVPKAKSKSKKAPPPPFPLPNSFSSAADQFMGAKKAPKAKAKEPTSSSTTTTTTQGHPPMPPLPEFPIQPPKTKKCLGIVDNSSNETSSEERDVELDFYVYEDLESWFCIIEEEQFRQFTSQDLHKADAKIRVLLSTLASLRYSDETAQRGMPELPKAEWKKYKREAIRRLKSQRSAIRMTFRRRDKGRSDLPSQHVLCRTRSLFYL